MLAPTGAAIGASFEKVLEWQHAEYAKHGQAIIYHNHTVGRFVAKDRFIADKSRPDYSGTIAPFGLSVHFDAKTTANQNYWTLPRDRIHQYVRLLEQSAAGALCFFLVECRPRSRAYLLRVHPAYAEAITRVGLRPAIDFEETPDIERVCELKERGIFSSLAFPCFSMPESMGGTYNWLREALAAWT